MDKTNIVGTFCLLEELRVYYQQLTASAQEQFRFVHVSTDEVYGSLTPDAAPFTETDAYQPNSPYAASKAASDHLVRAWHQTYGLPVITTHCSNNYGAYQFPEKIAYAMSKSINGPWEFKGILNELAGNSNTNHQAIISFKGKDYFIYHNGAIQPNGGSFRR